MYFIIRIACNIYLIKNKNYYYKWLKRKVQHGLLVTQHETY